MKKILCLVLLSAVGVAAHAAPVVLINCASDNFSGPLESIQKGLEAAGVVMADDVEARLRVDQVQRAGMTGLVGANGHVAVVRVVEVLRTNSEFGVTCRTFLGEPPVTPKAVAVHGTWVSGKAAPPQPPRRPTDMSSDSVNKK